MAPKRSWNDRLKRWEDARRERIAIALLSPPEHTTIMQAIPYPGVVLIMGARRKGKSGVAHKIMHVFHQRRHLNGAIYLPPTFLHLKRKLERLVPDWIQVVTSISRLPSNSVVLIDEAAQAAHARRTQSKTSVTLDNLIGISGQRSQLILFVSHHSRKLDPNVVHECDRVLWKPPTYAHALFERDEIHRFTFKALDFFEGLKSDKARLKATLVMDFHHLRFSTFNNELAPWWSEELSHLFEEFGEGIRWKGGKTSE